MKNKFQILYFILLISASAAGQTADSTILTVLKRVKLAGFTQVRFQHTLNSKQDGVDIPRARLDLKYATSQKWEYHLQVDFGGSSVKLLDATIGHTFSREFSLLTGQFKIPFSLENVASDANLDFINRAQVVEAMVARSRDITGNQNGRDIGLQISGSIIRMNDTSLVDYYAAVVNGQGINIADANLYKDFAGRIVLHPLKRLSVGGSVYSGYDRIFFFGPNVVRNRFGGEISWSWKDLVLQGEYIHGKDGMARREGYYGYGGYYLLKRKIELLVKYDFLDSNINGSAVGGINYFFAGNVKLMVNYQWQKVRGLGASHDLVLAQLQIAL